MRSKEHPSALLPGTLVASLLGARSTRSLELQGGQHCAERICSRTNLWFWFTIAGVVLATIALFVLPWDKGFANQTSQIMEESTKAFSSADGIKILHHEKSVRGDDIAFIGQLKNEGQTTARNFSIEVELFDKDKKFVDACRESFYSLTVRPGEERNFKVSCISCRNRPIPEHASYTIRVSSSM